MSEADSHSSPPRVGQSDPRYDTTGEPSGRDAEFTAFYRAWTKPLVGFLVLQGASVVLAADLAQDAMAAIYRRWSEVEHPRAWVFKTASRALIRAVTTVRETPTAEPSEPSPLLRRPVTDIEKWEQQHEIVELVRRLPPRQRQVMAWTLYGHTPKEIAEQLGLSSEAVRSNLHHARTTLSTHLAREEDGR
ncbi:RNA polymerase sigma factor [Saccharothrix sp. NRRL B-16348]|uniref:RNA polymerase sigma factor n=1 Tax=Saccharothrix sp. NRRL B-16348 TaxID=1415542 RepID=UPI0009E83FAA|nr:sigma-70 family RNA polymerase sigma factor [Saccharothrix sp. NRRL B-16348]